MKEQNEYHMHISSDLINELANLCLYFFRMLKIY